jgi:DNA-binding transcriptional MerR regulator
MESGAAMSDSGLMQIGEVAERTALSLRTIRYYEEVGLVVPSERSQGRFRLYTEADVRRLWLIRKLKPLDLSLDQIRELITALDRADAEDVAAEEAAALRSTLTAFHSIARADTGIVVLACCTAAALAALLTARSLAARSAQQPDNSHVSPH